MRLHLTPSREGFTTKHQTLYRLYRWEHLAIRRIKGKRVPRVPRQPKPVPIAPNDQWSMDFVHDTLLLEGAVIRALRIEDDRSRKCPGRAVARSIPGQHAARALALRANAARRSLL